MNWSRLLGFLPIAKVRGTHIGTVVLLASLALSGIGAAEAQPVEAFDVEQANARGKELFRKQDFGAAIEVWEEAFYLAQEGQARKLAKNLSIAYYRADEEDLDKVFYYFLFWYSGISEEERTAKARERISLLKDALSPSHGLVTIDATPKGALVYLEEKVPERRFRAPYAGYLPPGEHTFIVVDGQREEMRTIIVQEGQEQAEYVDFTEPRALAGASLDESTFSGTDAEVGLSTPLRGFGDWSRYGPWLLLGTGVALGATGGVLEWMAIDREADIHDKYQAKLDEHILGLPQEKWTGEMDFWQDQKESEFKNRNVQTFDRAGITLMVAGSLAAAGGLTWWLLRRSSVDSPSSAVIPDIGPDGRSAGFSFSTTF